MKSLIEQRMNILKAQLQQQESMVQQMQANVIALRGALQFAQDLLDAGEVPAIADTDDDEKLVPFPTAEPAKSLE